MLWLKKTINSVPHFLRRMDQRQKEIEAELAALKAEKDAAVSRKNGIIP